jgi:outer membrane protein
MRKVLCEALLLFLALLPLPAWPDELPLWEAGFGFTGLSLPDYRGSSQQRFFVLPFPYLVYRGEFLRLDRKGLYGLLFQSDRVQLNISADGGLPVKSNKNNARDGMPNLDPTFQIGPALEICISETCNGDRLVQFRLPLRAVFASDFTYLAGIGFVVNPQLNFDLQNIGPGGGWNAGFALGPLYATKQYHDYYYRVDPAYAVPGFRSAYDPAGGYSGSLAILTVSKRFTRIWFGSFLRYDYLEGAVFQNSPLMRTKHSVMAGFGIAWVFGQSTELVQAAP